MHAHHGECTCTVESARALSRKLASITTTTRLKVKERLATHELWTHNVEEHVNSLFCPFNVADYTPGTNNLGQLSLQLPWKWK